MTKPNKSAAFLQAMSSPSADASVAEDRMPANPAPTMATKKRAGLKHIGGYFARGDVEKFAILRARLGLDNSELIKLAIDELYAKHEAKRHFGDA